MAGLWHASGKTFTALSGTHRTMAHYEVFGGGAQVSLLEFKDGLGSGVPSRAGASCSPLARGFSIRN